MIIRLQLVFIAVVVGFFTEHASQAANITNVARRALRGIERQGTRIHAASGISSQSSGTNKAGELKGHAATSSVEDNSKATLASRTASGTIAPMWIQTPTLITGTAVVVSPAESAKSRSMPMVVGRSDNRRIT